MEDGCFTAAEIKLEATSLCFPFFILDIENQLMQKPSS